MMKINLSVGKPANKVEQKVEPAVKKKEIVEVADRKVSLVINPIVSKGRMVSLAPSNMNIKKSNIIPTVEGILMEADIDHKGSSTKITLKLGAGLAAAAKEAEDLEIKTLTSGEMSFGKEYHEIEGFNANVFESNMLYLADELVNEDPKVRNYLRDIYKNLKQYPELSHLLDDRKIGLVVAGFKKMRNIEIKTTKPANKINAMLEQVANQTTEDLLDSKAW